MIVKCLMFIAVGWGEGDGRGSRSPRPREGCPTITTQPSNLTKWSPAVPLERLAIRLSLGGS